MANWENLERDLEAASLSVHSRLPDAAPHIHQMRAALREWPGMKTILEILISDNRRLNREVNEVYGRLQQAHEERQR